MYKNQNINDLVKYSYTYFFSFLIENHKERISLAFILLSFTHLKLSGRIVKISGMEFQNYNPLNNVDALLHSSEIKNMLTSI